MNNKSWLERLSHALLREPKDRAQLVELLHHAEGRHLLDTSAVKMIEGVMQISDQQVRDIMIPRTAMTVINIKQALNEILPIVIESAHSRFPVLKESGNE